MIINENIIQSKEISTQVCNAFGCDNTATDRIVVPVSTKSVTIFVCENCISKFEDN
ncbi:MAG TPA: hypothetical protein VFC05_01125 [Nitrososphaeraceae archaeon]|nr:hypothetical protein [Nitrososphaeraceae archaeon]